VQLALVNLGVLGKKQAYKVIVRIPGANFGAATRVKNMLSAMNFEEVSILRTYYDGQTVTPSEWKLKGHPNPFEQ